MRTSAMAFFAAASTLFPLCTHASGFETLDRAIAETVDREEVPGLAAALIDETGIVWAKGYGYADIEARRPVTPDTPFMIASISKTIIAIALRQAVDDGLVSLDADINSYLDFEVDLPRVEDERITLTHLASHTSGIRDGPAYGASYAAGDPNPDMSPWLSAYFTPGGEHYHNRANFLREPPGEMHVYSNVGAALAAHVIAAKSGMTYADYCAKHLFEPLGLKHTAFMIDAFPADTVAIPYNIHGDTPERLEHYGYPTYPDGQLRTSVTELGLILAAVINGGTAPNGTQLLAAQSAADMFTVLYDGSDEGGARQALFWYVRRDGTIGHSGGDDGVATDMFFDPKRKAGGIVLINAAGSRAVEDALHAVRRLLHGCIAGSDASTNL